jgi:succinate dehydrogenase / fumarate reductase flavoprotein subunit
MIYHQAIIVGGGLAGLRAAIELNRRGVDVAILSKVHPLRSHTVAAQGGINVAIGNNPLAASDNPPAHAFDTVRGSDYLADQKAVLKMCQMGPELVYEMEHWGCPFSRNEDGRIAQRPFGGADLPRTCYAADRTGHAILNTVFERAVYHEATIYSEWLVTSLAVDDGEVHGLTAMDLRTGKIEPFMCDAVIFATGGAGRLYGRSTNALINTGMGMAVPYWAGVPLKDMEFIQFHPTTLFGTNILVSEGARGEGAYLLNNRGERFLADYEDSREKMELSPRDIVARNMMREIEKGGGFDGCYMHLDLRHLGKKRIEERLPGIRELSIKFAGVDPEVEPIPVQPGQHYTMGGIDTDDEGKTTIRGLFAAGECACVSVHGANRLGGNSLLEALVFGFIAGEGAASYISGREKGKGERVVPDALKREEEKLDRLRRSAGGERVADLWDELNWLMDGKVGIFRDEPSLRWALNKVMELKERSKDLSLSYKGGSFNYELYWALELKGGIDVAEAVVLGALERKESRGSHFRTDYPSRDDEGFLRHTIAKYSDEGPSLSCRDVDVSLFEPKERKY